MKREFLQNLKVNDQQLPKEVIDAIMAENGRDVESVKATLETVKNELDEAKTTISDLKKNVKNADELQAVIDRYVAEEEQRQKDAEAAQERSERLGRFEKAHAEAGKDRKWLNDFTRDGIFAQFEKALADDANKGKSDVQIYNAIVNDDKGVKPGLFEAQAGASGGNPGGMGGNTGGDAAYLQQFYKGNPFFVG